MNNWLKVIAIISVGSGISKMIDDAIPVICYLKTDTIQDQSTNHGGSGEPWSVSVGVSSTLQCFPYPGGVQKAKEEVKNILEEQKINFRKHIIEQNRLGKAGIPGADEDGFE